jgi:F-type H+-transporting ATPase subunit b
MSTIAHIWNIIVNSNTFNFIIFVAILVWIFQKINIKKIIASLQESIIEKINQAKEIKEKALNDLKNTEKSVENLASEIKEFKDNAEQNAEKIAGKILEDAEKQVVSIENNAKKVIEAEENKLVSILTKDTAKASISSAEKKIISELKNDLGLHQKYIDDSIDELERLSF